MPILTDDIKIYESDTMDDTAQGGGQMTGNVIVDGQSNNMFEDISTLDRTYGAVKMRKIFPAVFTQTQDKYFGSHLIISKLPKDEKIGVNLFNTENWFDRRPDAKSRVENYRAKGAKYNGYLWATQWKDSKVLTLFQSETAAVPVIGDVLYLTNSNESQTQYVKITEVSESLQEFEDGNGKFFRNVVTLEISQNLEYDFVGVEVARTPSNPDATINQTVVANAAKYYSARPLATAANNTDLSLTVDTVYSQVIPSSLTEVAILDADAYGTTIPVIESSSGTVDVSISPGGTWNVGEKIYLGSPCVPGTFIIPSQSGSIEITDSGGNLKRDNVTVGSIDYPQGEVTFSSDVASGFGSGICQFNPAGAPQTVADTAMLPVDETNRGFIWNTTISPPPKPDSLEVSYMALGEWYNLSDNGTGGIEGDEAGIGSGTINYVTGTVSVTLSALPDDQTAIVFTWGKDAEYFNRSNVTPTNVEYEYQLPDAGIAPSTVVITWNDGSARTATTSAQGVISGDATGSVDHNTGLVKWIPNSLPLGGTEFTIDYDTGTPVEETFDNLLTSGGDLNITLSNTNIIENTVEVGWTVGIEYINNPNLFKQTLAPANPNQFSKDDGVGALTDVAGSTIDYINGQIIFNPNVSVDIKIKEYETVTYNRCF